MIEAYRDKVLIVIFLHVTLMWAIYGFAVPTEFSIVSELRPAHLTLYRAVLPASGCPHILYAYAQLQK